MAILEINQIGAITQARLDVRRITLLIGPQSSGKSTVAKILSFCAWMEKQALIDNSCEHFDEDWFAKHLLSFHQIKSYVKEGSSFTYTSGELVIYYEYGSAPLVTWGEKKEEAQPVKIAYIPSERNLVSIPNITSLQLPSNYIRSFIFDWFSLRQKYTPEQPIDILDLNVKYHYSENNTQDILTLKNTDQTLTIDEVSSGLQSLVPLIVMIDYMTAKMQDSEVELSYDQMRRIVKNHLGKEIPSALRAFTKTNPLFHPKIAHMIIEEPEQNLFPDAQCALVDYIVRIAQDTHRVLMTTHSPYILLAINNMLLRSVVESHVPDDEIEALLTDKPKLTADETRLYEITSKGEILLIQDEEGLLEKNYLNATYSRLGHEFGELLNYYTFDD